MDVSGSSTRDAPVPSGLSCASNSSNSLPRHEIHDGESSSRSLSGSATQSLAVGDAGRGAGLLSNGIVPYRAVEKLKFDPQCRTTCLW